MRTVFLGTSDFAVGVLERLVRSDHKPVLVVTRPDRPRGRGRKVQAPPVADAARLLGLELYQPESVNSEEALARIGAADPDAVCICAFGALIKEPLLSAFPMLNVHPSLLPRWRGAAPIERAIMAGDEKTGVTIMVPVETMDAGPICLDQEEPIRPDDDYGSLSRRLRVIGGELLVKALDERPQCHPQADEGATIAPKIETADRRLDPARPPDELERRVRALHPHIGAFIELANGERLGVERAAVPDHAPPIDPGALEGMDGCLFFGCVGGALELLEVKPPGGRAMGASAYLRGRGANLVRAS